MKKKKKISFSDAHILYPHDTNRDDQQAEPLLNEGPLGPVGRHRIAIRCFMLCRA